MMLTRIPRSCDNCRRRGEDINLKPYDRVRYNRRHRLAYYAIPRECKRAFLCGCCDRYIIEQSKNASDYWPPMVYIFLTHKNAPNVLKVPFKERWKAVPQNWRPWWQFEFRQQIDQQGSRHDECLFVDVTQELEDFNSALSELKWLRLAREMDKHLAYSEVRTEKVAAFCL